MYSVYRLLDPRNHLVKYVGSTNNFERRLHEHLTIYETASKSKWIRELKRLGLQPIAEVIESHEDGKVAAERETYWLQHYHASGAPLINTMLQAWHIEKRGGKRKPIRNGTLDGFPVLLTVKEAADQLGTSAPRVRYWIQSGKLPCTRLSSHQVRIILTDLEDFKKARAS